MKVNTTGAIPNKNINATSEAQQNRLQQNKLAKGAEGRSENPRGAGDSVQLSDKAQALKEAIAKRSQTLGG